MCGIQHVCTHEKAPLSFEILSLVNDDWKVMMDINMIDDLCGMVSGSLAELH